MKLFNNKIERKIKIKIWSLTKKYARELTAFYFSFYNWRELSKIKVQTPRQRLASFATEEILTELGFI